MSGQTHFLTKLTSKLKSNAQASSGLNTFVNPYSYLLLRKNAYLLDSLDHIFVDGGLLVKVLNATLGLQLKRVSFDMTSLAPIVFKQSITEQKHLFLVGSKQKQIEQAVTNFTYQFPELNLAGVRNGYFAGQEKQLFIQKIVKTQPDILICGMGTPQQEQMLIDLKKAGWQGTGFTCGGFFHQSAKKLNYYPAWINRFNLRWLYRIYDEPKLLKRYTWDYSKFLLVYTYDLLCHLNHKNKTP